MVALVFVFVLHRLFSLRASLLLLFLHFELSLAGLLERLRHVVTKVDELVELLEDDRGGHQCPVVQLSQQTRRDERSLLIAKGRILEEPTRLLQRGVDEARGDLRFDLS